MKKLLSLTEVAEGKAVQMTPGDLEAARREVRKIAAEATARQLAAWQSSQKVHIK